MASPNFFLSLSPNYMFMKNIHVLSTDKETILHYDHTGLFLSRNYQLSNTINSIVQGRNIYITSDTADIYDNDYIITKDGRLVQVSFLLSSDLDGASKVILTTDTDLLKDNIQKINSEFLVWFVNNPSCEYVQVEINYKKFKKGNITLSNCYELIIPKEIKCYDKFNQRLSEGDYVDVQKDGPHQIYKKEDGQLYFKPYGQEDKVSSYFSNDMVKCDSEGNWITNDRYEETEDVIGRTYFDILKQEAIEEEMEEYDFEENLENAAKKYWETNKFKSDYPHCPLSFKDGAKWYQEQDKLSEWNIRQEEQFNCNLKLIGEFGAGYDAGYAEAEKELFSKEEVLEQLNLLYSMKNALVDTFTDDNDYITMKWFEQFNK